jgi:hypothetical protein
MRQLYHSKAWRQALTGIKVKADVAVGSPSGPLNNLTPPDAVSTTGYRPSQVCSTPNVLACVPHSIPLASGSRIGPASQPQTLQPDPPGRAFGDRNSRAKLCEG